MKQILTICLSAIMMIALAQNAFAGVGEAPWNTNDDDADRYVALVIEQIKNSTQWKYLENKKAIEAKLTPEWVREWLNEAGNTYRLAGCFVVINHEDLLEEKENTIARKFKGELAVRAIKLKNEFQMAVFDPPMLGIQPVLLFVDEVIKREEGSLSVGVYDFVAAYYSSCPDDFFDPEQKDLVTEGDGVSGADVKTGNGKPKTYEGTGALKNLGQTTGSGSDDAANVIIINNYGGGNGTGAFGGVPVLMSGPGWNIGWNQYWGLNAGFGFWDPWFGGFGGGFGYYQYPPLTLGDPWLPYALQNQQFQYAQAGYLGSGSSPALTYQGGGGYYGGGGTFGGTTVIYGSGGTQGPRDGSTTIVTGGGGQQPRLTAVTTETLAEEFFAELDASPRIVVSSSNGTMQSRPAEVRQPQGSQSGVVDISGLPGMGQTARMPSTQVTTQPVSSFQQVVRPQTGTTTGRQVDMPTTQVARSPQVVSGTMPAAVQPARQVARPMVQPVARPAAVQPARMAAPTVIRRR